MKTGETSLSTGNMSEWINWIAWQKWNIIASYFQCTAFIGAIGTSNYRRGKKEINIPLFRLSIE